jgi:hypothetical protein
MDHVLGHLVRRGMEAHASFRAAGEPSPEEPPYKMPVWGIVLLAGTSIFFLLMVGTVSGQSRAASDYS